jgi:hypothetical protein
MTDQELKELHKKCYLNIDALASCSEAGCFYCQRIIDPTTVEKWVDKGFATAICPRCGIDSLLPGVTDPDVLKEMYVRWF